MMPKDMFFYNAQLHHATVMQKKPQYDTKHVH